jgi:hypothetical protein
MIAMGQPEEVFCLLEILYRLSVNQPLSSTPTVQSASEITVPASSSSVSSSHQARKKKEKFSDVGFVSSVEPPRQSSQSQSQSETIQRRQRQDDDKSMNWKQQQEPKRQIKFGENQTQFIPTRQEAVTDDSDISISGELSSSCCPSSLILIIPSLRPSTFL